MKRMLLLLSLVLALLHGCVMVKIGGVKSTERSELSRNLQETRIESLVSIEPRLTQSGELTLWVTGRFWDTYDVQNKVVDYGDEWMAIGLFPGYDDLSNGYIFTNRIDGLGSVVVPIIVNGLFCGLPTVGSLLEFLDSKPAKRHSNCGLARMGLVGTYKYEGARYEMNTYEGCRSDVKHYDALRLLTDYRIVVDGLEMNDMSDRNGIVSLGREFNVGDVISFRIVTIPQCPQVARDIFEPFINREFKAICK